MVDIDESYQLIYKMNPDEQIIINGEFLKKINNNDFSVVPKNVSIKPEGIEFFELEFSDKKKIKIFRYIMTCKLKDLNNPIQIVSCDHLKLIMKKKMDEKIYKIPYFYSKLYRDKIFIDVDKIEDLEIYFDDYIEIKDKEIEDDLLRISQIFKEEEKFYKNYDFKKYTFKSLSSNFNSYFPDLKVNLTDEFFYIHGQNRKGLKKKFKIFLIQKGQESVYPICGPHGTGKTISTLIFHKLLFVNDGKRGLYLNLKYYALDNVKLEDKVETLLKECFFICDNDKEFSMLYEKFIIKNNIYEIFEVIKNFINDKYGKNKDKKNIYIIIDQYQEKFNMDYLLDFFSKMKIILLSSINDDDVKKNIIITYEEQMQQNFNDTIQTDYKKESKKIIRYHYIDNLIDNNYYESQIFKDLIRNKIIKKLLKEKKEEKVKKKFEEKSKKEDEIKKEEKLINEDEIKKEEKLINEDEIKTEEKLINEDEIKKEEKLINEDEIKKEEKLIIEEEEEKKLEEKEKQEDEKKLEDDIIKKEGKKIEEELQLIYDILKQFDFIPKYFFGYLYKYNSILDLLFYEYSNIMKKLTKFLYNKIIDIETINILIKKKNLVQKKEIQLVQTLDKINFIQNVRKIPLKYINFKENNNETFYFYYSFPLFDTILKDFITYQSDKNNFFESSDGGERGVIFERILKYQFRVYNKFDIDGYFKVVDLIKMNPTEEYKGINKEYIMPKNNIFIDQTKKKGKDYDFAIYKPKSNILLLFQSKYIIHSGTVKKYKTEYKKTAKESLTAFNELTKLNALEVYLFFISSIYYNYYDRKDVVNTLSNKQINCIFYSIKKDQFFYNFRDQIREIDLDISSKVFPFSNNYKEQIALDNSEFKEKIDYNINNTIKETFKMEVEESEDDGEKENLFLKKKTYRSINDLEKIYNEIIIYIQDYSKFKNESIIKLLGALKRIESYSDQIEYNPKSQYAILLYLNEKDMTIEKDRKIGLIIFNNGVHYFIDLKENKNYESLEELIFKFEMGYFYAIGKKKK